MTDDITRAEIEQTKEKLLDGLQFSRHRLKDFQLQAAMGGDEQPMLDEMEKIDRIEAKLAGVGYAFVQVEQNERAALSAAQVAARAAAVEELRSLMASHASAIIELEAMATKMLPIGDNIASLAADIDHVSSSLFSTRSPGGLRSITPQESFLLDAGALQAPDFAKSLRTLLDFARRVADERDRALQKLDAVAHCEAKYDGDR